MEGSRKMQNLSSALNTEVGIEFKDRKSDNTPNRSQQCKQDQQKKKWVWGIKSKMIKQIIKFFTV